MRSTVEYEWPPPRHRIARDRRLRFLRNRVHGFLSGSFLATLVGIIMLAGDIHPGFVVAFITFMWLITAVLIICWWIAARHD